MEKSNKGSEKREEIDAVERGLTKACTGARGVSFISFGSNPARPVMPGVRRL